MRLLSGFALAVLVSGCLWAQHHGSSSPGHAGAASSGTRWTPTHPVPHFRSTPSMVMVPWAYAAPYGYDAPADPSYADSHEAPPTASGDDQPVAPRYAATAEPPPHSVILNLEDTDADPPAEPPHYFVALKDHRIYVAVAYWVEGDTLHYFLPGNTHNQVSLSLVDRDLTGRLNRESGTEVRLPGK